MKSNKIGIMTAKEMDCLCNVENSVNNTTTAIRLLIEDIKADDYQVSELIETLSYCQKEISKVSGELDRINRTHSRQLFESGVDLDPRDLINMREQGIITNREYQQALKRLAWKK